MDGHLLFVFLKRDVQFSEPVATQTLTLRKNENEL